MDFTAILGVLPTLGPVGLVLLILAYISKSWLSSDARYQSEIERLSTAHDNELAELREEIRRLREDISQLRDELAEERKLRFKAEEEAHRIRLSKEAL